MDGKEFKKAVNKILEFEMDKTEVEIAINFFKAKFHKPSIDKTEMLRLLKGPDTR
jgi:hypothetical protein